MLRGDEEFYSQVRKMLDIVQSRGSKEQKSDAKTAASNLSNLLGDMEMEKENRMDLIDELVRICKLEKMSECIILSKHLREKHKLSMTLRDIGIADVLEQTAMDILKK